MSTDPRSVNFRALVVRFRSTRRSARACPSRRSVAGGLPPTGRPFSAAHLPPKRLRGTGAQRVAQVSERLQGPQQTERGVGRRARPGAQQPRLNGGQKRLGHERGWGWLEGEQVSREPPVDREADG